jgi:outer membrane protease
MMEKRLLVVVGVIWAVVFSALLVSAGAATLGDEAGEPERSEKSAPSVVDARQQAPGTVAAKQQDAGDPFAIDDHEDAFWTKGELRMGVEKWYGDNTYQIGYPVHWYATGLVEYGYFPFSELEFPLDVSMFSAQYDLEIKNRWMFSFSFKTDMDHSGDDMEDSDWITAANPDRLDVYSTANVTDFKAYEYDVNVKFKYLKGATWSLDAGLGYLFQKYKYDTALKTQYSPSGLPGYDFVWDGRTSSIKYDLFYQIPYVQLGGAVTFAKRFTVRVNGSYSPVVHAEDEDQHLLRGVLIAPGVYTGKVNKGDLDGDCWMAELETRYQINRSWFVTLEYGYKKIEVDGKMEGVFNFFPSLTHTVWEELESEQHSGSLMVGYSY